MSSTSTLQSSETVHLRITMPEFPDVQMVMTFSADDTIWSVKQKFLQNLKKDLTDGQNYGLYIPPASCRSGKFLDEERCLRDYPLTGGIKYYEFKYKTRIKYSYDVSSMKLKKVNTVSNQKDFLEWVRRDDTDRVSKLLHKGFNPNYNHLANGETPLTLATTLNKPRNMLINLVSGGAFIDYRDQNGHTPLHKAVINKNKDAMRTLLDFGCSPNYKDKNSLTPLYLCCKEDVSLQLTSMLLHERAQLQCRDSNGFTELHHACKRGKMELVEQLVFYGADLNSQDNKGNTPLHICAETNRMDCCKVLLMRGAEKNIINNDGKTAALVSKIKSNSLITQLIENFKSSEIIYFNDLPVYNDKRRGLLSAATIRSLEKSRSNPNLHLLFKNQFNPISTISVASLNTLVNQPNNRTKSYENNGTLKNSMTEHPKNDNLRKSETNLPNGHAVNHSNNSPINQRLSAMDISWKGNTVEAPKDEKQDSAFEEVELLLIKEAKMGFGFSLRNINEINAENPCRQFFNEVNPDKSAAAAGLKVNDYLYEINGKNVKDISHRDCVEAIKASGAQIRVKVLRKKTAMSKGSNVETFQTNNRNENNFTNTVKTEKVVIETRSSVMNHDTNSKDSNKVSEFKGSDESDSSGARENTTIQPVPLSAGTLSQKELQDSIPKPPPLPDIDTIKLIKNRQSIVAPDEPNFDNNNNLSIKSKPKEVLSSPIDSDAHNALLDAIKRRKQLVDDVGAESLSASIENKVNQSRKLNGSGKSNFVENNKTLPKRESIMPSNTSNKQNYGLLASGTSSVIMNNSSTFKSEGKSNVKSSDIFDSERQVYHAKTLPKNVKKLSEENNGTGFLADAEKLRLLFLQKKFNSNKNLAANINDESNSKAQTENEKSKDNDNEMSKENEVPFQSRLIPNESENTMVSTILNSPPITLPKPVSDDVIESKKTNDQPHKNDLHSKLFEEIKNTKNSDNILKPTKPQLKVETNINNQNQAHTPTASPSIAALANIVAERAQQKRDTIQKIQEPSSGQSKTYFSGNTLNKNIVSPKIDNPKPPAQKPTNLTNTSNTKIETKLISNKPPLISPTSSNKKLYSSSKAPVSPPTGITKEKSLPVKNLVTRSSENQSVFSKIDNTNSTKTPTSPNNVTNLTKNFQTNVEKTVPISPPKPLIKSANINKFNDYKSSQENNKVLNLASNFNNNSKPQKKIITSFIKSNSEPSDPPKKQNDVINGKSTTPVSSPSDDTYPTLRKTPQTTNTLVFKAKPSSTPNSPPTRKL